MIGVKISDTVEPWCYEVTRDNIRHYAHGIGDDNPLWCDPQYAASTSYGRLVAPPSFVFALNRILSGYVGGLPGIHAMWSGSDITWHRPLIQGDAIHCEAYLKDLIPHETRFAGRAIQQIYHVDFYNQRDELLVGADSWCFRTERDTAREVGTKYDGAKDDPEPYTDDELERVWSLYAGETVRGSDPRPIDTVAVGDELPTMVKGPMTVSGFIAYAQGWGGLYIRANRLAWKQLQRHPGLGIPDRFGIPDVPERVHWDDRLARLVGTPRAYDYGPERCSWLIHHLTDWMGDDGFLVQHSCRIRRHNPIGDIVTITGRVRAITSDDRGRPCVEVEQRAVNQGGELSATGVGVVRLPSEPGRSD
ncbi:MAG: MaoC family dehydratase N-terminal domain-containing protein [Acidimicrobiaceae bacterium]|nr:MaoC family dehydratase N-terminal domain-containing protein [Acidimicrobiaceae bacterium]